MPANLFDSLTLKSLTLRNRILVAPMCQYMATEGVPNEWHRVHYAGLARGGAAVVQVEATAVSPEGRISWGDTGLWNDEQLEAFRPIVASIKAAGAIPGIQIAHAGRKASANRPWEGDNHIPLGQPNSWETIAPSPLAFGGGLTRVPREMTLADIARVQTDVVRTAERALAAGFEWLQLHFAHGYLAQNFYSVHSNQRSDNYGGSAENRARYMFETFKAVRRVWPDKFPLAVRLGSVEFDGQDDRMLAESIALLKRLKEEGLDLVDVSIGFNTPSAKIPWAANFLVDIAQTVRRETGLPGTTSWYISKADEAQALLQQDKLDLITLGRPLLSDPHWPYHAAQQLGIKDAAWATLPPPYAHWLSRYR